MKLFGIVFTGLLLGLMPANSDAAVLASWDFENGNLAATSQGNFVATSIEVVNLGSIAFAAGSGVGGGGALAFDHPTADTNSVILFGIQNTHPTETISLGIASQTIGGYLGEFYSIFYELGDGLGDVDDSVENQGEWTTFSFDVGLQGFGAGLAPGESFSFGWGLAGYTGSGPLSPHFFDNISITGTEPIPEPSGSLLLLAGAGLLLRRRRR